MKITKKTWLLFVMIFSLVAAPVFKPLSVYAANKSQTFTWQYKANDSRKAKYKKVKCQVTYPNVKKYIGKSVKK